MISDLTISVIRWYINLYKVLPNAGSNIDCPGKNENIFFNDCLIALISLFEEFLSYKYAIYLPSYFLYKILILDVPKSL
jgi:hypothetical protein